MRSSVPDVFENWFEELYSVPLDLPGEQIQGLTREDIKTDLEQHLFCFAVFELFVDEDWTGLSSSLSVLDGMRLMRLRNLL